MLTSGQRRHITVIMMTEFRWCGFLVASARLVDLHHPPFEGLFLFGEHLQYACSWSLFFCSWCLSFQAVHKISPEEHIFSSRNSQVGRLTVFLVGVRRTGIEAGWYKAGWTRLSTGGRKRKRRVAAVAAAPRTGSRGRVASSGAAGDGDGRGLDDPRCPPVAFRRGGSLLLPLVDCRVPVDGDGSDGGD